MKKILSLLFVITLMLLIPTVAFADEGGTLGTGVTWHLSDDGTLTLGGTGAIKETSTYPWRGKTMSLHVIFRPRNCFTRLKTP